MSISDCWMNQKRERNRAQVERDSAIRANDCPIRIIELLRHAECGDSTDLRNSTSGGQVWGHSSAGHSLQCGQLYPTAVHHEAAIPAGPTF